MFFTAPDYKEVVGPLVFLAGPIQGAEDWQQKVVEYILQKCPTLNIASPRGNYSERKFIYEVQVDWETHYLSLASKTGAILFWLSKEREHLCHRAYAQTTRVEISEWVTKYIFNKEIKLFIGIEPGFTGERYLQRRMGQDCPEIAIHSSLEDVCKDLCLHFCKTDTTKEFAVMSSGHGSGMVLSNNPKLMTFMEAVLDCKKWCGIADTIGGNAQIIHIPSGTIIKNWYDYI